MTQVALRSCVVFILKGFKTRQDKAKSNLVWST